MKKPIVISDPFPRTLDLIFTKKKLKELKVNLTRTYGYTLKEKKLVRQYLHLVNEK